MEWFNNGQQAPAPGVDPARVVKGQRFAVGPDPVWFCELGSQADRCGAHR